MLECGLKYKPKAFALGLYFQPVFKNILNDASLY